MYTKKQRSLALLICGVIFFITLFSISFIGHELNHNCTGEDCPVCACVHNAEQSLRQLGTGFSGEVSGAFLILLFLSFLPRALHFIPADSLVIHKVRLNN